MKLWIPHGAMFATSNASQRPDGISIEGGLQLVRRDSWWRKCVLGTFVLFACAYAALLLISGNSCSVSSVSSYDSEEADSAYCRLAAWSSTFVSPTSSDPSRVVLPVGQSPTLAPVHNVCTNTSQALVDRRNTSIDPTVDRKNTSIDPIVASRSTSIDRIVFGIGANVGSWTQRREYLKLWWKAGLTRGFVWVDENLETWEDGDPPFKVSENTSRFGYTHGENARSAVRIARIVSESFQLDLPNVDWFVMGDDDTLFFTDNLVRVLSKYDHTKFQYIGQSSEDTRQSERHLHGLAFGGGGFAISYPLAKSLSGILDDCMERYTGLYGSDERVKACMSELGVPLTKEPGFHQLDVRGDVSGLLAAHPVAPIVTLHHLDDFEPIFPGTTHLEAIRKLTKAADVSPGSVFQQSICYDEEKKWSFSVSWGYVVEVYEGFVAPRTLEMPATTFISWAWRRGFEAFTMDTRPLASVCDRPTRFFMVNAATAGNGSERIGTSSYYRLTEFENKDCKAKNPPLNVVKMILVENQPMLDEWYQSPRRQCCTVDRLDSQFINIRVRGCGESESLVVGRKLGTTRKVRRILR